MEVWEKLKMYSSPVTYMALEPSKGSENSRALKRNLTFASIAKCI